LSPWARHFVEQSGLFDDGVSQFIELTHPVAERGSGISDDRW
jgi:hypothetical protein